MTKSKILVVEDDPRVVVFVVDQLEYLGYEVATARNGIEALGKVNEAKPDLIVLDVMMPKMDGYELCHRLKASIETKDIPILMLTAKGQPQDLVKGIDIGADDYLPKPYKKEELAARVKALLRRVRFRYPARSLSEACTMEVVLFPGQPIQLTLRGAASIVTATQATLRIDERTIEGYARRAQNAYRSSNWRFEVKNIGETLNKEIFKDHLEVSNCYNRAEGEVSKESDLRLVFKAPRTFLRLPFEFMFNGPDYLVLQHSLSRFITESHARRPSISAETLNAFLGKQEELRILLVASNTDVIDAVDEEIVALNDMFGKALFHDLDCNVTCIPTNKATYERIRNELRRCQYHIFHYAGHGHYSAISSEESCLYFWEQPNCQGRVLPMRASELATLLRDSELRFAYLSCCWGTATGSTTQLLDDDFLGIADSIVQAGVPAVLGSRWPISDRGAKTLALTFYRSLAEQGELDTALLDARREVAAQNKDSMGWVSPILIMQA